MSCLTSTTRRVVLTAGFPLLSLSGSAFFSPSNLIDESDLSRTVVSLLLYLQPQPDQVPVENTGFHSLSWRSLKRLIVFRFHQKVLLLFRFKLDGLSLRYHPRSGELLVVLCLQADQLPVGNTGCHTLLGRSLRAYYLPNRFHNPDELSVQLNVLVIGYSPVSFQKENSPPAYILSYNTFLVLSCVRKFL